MSTPENANEPKTPAEKVKTFPHRPGVYLMKNAAGVVIYIGKAKDLYSRAGSYFLKRAVYDDRINYWMGEVQDIDFIETDSEVDALLAESRLIKDIQPKYNKDLKDSKTFPYLQIRTREPFPRVEITRQPKSSGVKLFGPFTKPTALKGAVLALQKVFKFRTCTLSIEENDERWRWFRPCVLYSIHQCSGPCNFRIKKGEYRKNIVRLIRFFNGKKKRLLLDLKAEMRAAASEKHYETAAELRDQIHDLETLPQRGSIETDIQPEVFAVDPRRGVIALKKIFKLETFPRVIEGIDIAHLSGTDMVAGLVHFIDGLPFKPGYRHFKIRTVNGIDDFACMAEVVSRRFSHTEAEHPAPDILLIDGGKGQLHSVLDALSRTPLQPGLVISLAKREEEVYVPDWDEPLRLSKHSFALRLLQYVRDESHRFAQHYHHILRGKRIP
ncbi:MAG: excinuclease ABC subunit UvrC [Planctomycetaceae bacterium]|jgi:excinuclease ABC subunit C|nr:excinuclease ABC subunit UvrC [Planctomycetaceae bacterium]